MENNVGKNLIDQAKGCAAFFILIAIVSAPAGVLAVTIYGIFRINNSLKISRSFAITVGIIVGIVWAGIMLYYGGDGTTSGFRFGQEMMKISVILFVPGCFGWYWILNAETRDEERQKKKKI